MYKGKFYVSARKPNNVFSLQNGCGKTLVNCLTLSLLENSTEHIILKVTHFLLLLRLAIHRADLQERKAV
jgi:hypothetical protein